MSLKRGLKANVITGAAIKVFADKGYHPSRTLDIAQEAGVAYGSLYQYFSSKDDILLSIFHESWENIVNRIAKISKSRISPPEKLSKISDAIFRSYQNDPDLMKVLVMEVPRLFPFQNMEHQKLYHCFFHHLAEIFIEGQKSGDFRKDISPMIAAFVIYGAIDMTIRQYVFNSDLNHESIPMDGAKQQIMKLLNQGCFDMQSKLK